MTLSASPFTVPTCLITPHSTGIEHILMVFSGSSFIGAGNLLFDAFEIQGIAVKSSM